MFARTPWFLIHWHVFESDAVDKPLRPMANRLWVFCLGSGPVFVWLWCFAVCFAVSSGETQVWLGDLRVVVFGWFWRLCVFLIDLPAQMDMICPCTNVFPAYAHVRTEPLARHRPHSREKKPPPDKKEWSVFVSDHSFVFQFADFQF